MIEIFDPAGKVTYRNSFIIDWPVSRDTVAELAVCGQARWNIENEAFNSLKTKGYHLELHFGHGLQTLHRTGHPEPAGRRLPYCMRMAEQAGARPCASPSAPSLQCRGKMRTTGAPSRPT